MDLNQIAGDVSNAMTTIRENVPPSVRQNFLKACDRLGSSLLDIPIAHLEGIAQKIRAKNESQKKLMSTVGDSIASKIETAKEYSDYAVEKYSKKILREQVNIDAIATVAAEQINANTYSETITNNAEISNEWLDEFESIARVKSSEDMRVIFGKILAKEATKPGSISIKTLRIISQLDKHVAEKFLEFSKICVYVKNEDYISAVFAPEFTSGPFQVADFKSFDIAPSTIVLLREYGLLTDSKDYGIGFKHKDSEGVEIGICEFSIGNKDILLEKGNDLAKERTGMNAQVLSTAGVHLFSIIETTPHADLENKIVEFFKKVNYNVTYL